MCPSQLAQSRCFSGDGGGEARKTSTGAMAYIRHLVECSGAQASTRPAMSRTTWRVADIFAGTLLRQDFSYGHFNYSVRLSVPLVAVSRKSVFSASSGPTAGIINYLSRLCYTPTEQKKEKSPAPPPRCSRAPAPPRHGQSPSSSPAAFLLDHRDQLGESPHEAQATARRAACAELPAAGRSPAAPSRCAACQPPLGTTTRPRRFPSRKHGARHPCHSHHRHF